jgi:hypothetical protein
MRTSIYVLWSLVPLFFLLTWLWGVLERLGKEEKRGSSIDAFKQFLFVLFCVAVCIVIDQTILEDVVNSLFADFLPLPVYQVLLLPLILYLGALVIGPSKQILISKAPSPTKPKKRR